MDPKELTYILRLYNIYTMEQVIIKMEKKLKDQVMKKARREGSNLSSVLKSAARAYVGDEFEIGIKYSPKLVRDIHAAQKELNEGKGLTGDLRQLLKKYK